MTGTLLAVAVRAERERCAQIAQGYTFDPDGDFDPSMLTTPEDIAREIREQTCKEVGHSMPPILKDGEVVGRSRECTYCGGPHPWLR